MQKHITKRSSRHLRRADRDEIEILLNRGYKGAEIARVVGVHKSTISREIAKRKRKDGRYCAETAQNKAYVKRLHSKYQGMKVENMPLAKGRVIAMLQKCQSPDAIAGRMKREGIDPPISKDAIYRWLYSAWGNQYAKYLCTQRRRKRTQKKERSREMIPHRIPLAMRPLEGIHGEGDIFVSPRRTHTPVSVAVVCEQESKLIWGKRIPNRKPSTMAEAMREMCQSVSLDTLTMDNGIENKNHLDFGLLAFFCDPQSPWQKPLVEQTIGLIRRWFIPKGMDLRRVSEGMLKTYVGILNHKYRKSLGYRSSYEVAWEHGILKNENPAMMPVTNKMCRVAFEVRI